MVRSRMVWLRSMWWLTCTASAFAIILPTLAAGQEPGPFAGLGRPPIDAERRDSLVDPDGRELPEGSGTAVQGVTVYARRGCTACHGPTGSEGPAVALVGGQVTTRTNYWPIRHWPFAPSIWDYIRRAMPYDRPGTLTVDEVYAVTAFLLYRNDLISEDHVLDAQSLPLVQMPARATYQMPPPWTPETPRGFEIVPAR